MRCAELLREALALWRGTPYSGLDVPLLADEAERLTECRLTALEVLYQAELASGRHTAVVTELTDMARRHPLREGLTELLMLALWRCGRQSAIVEMCARLPLAPRIAGELLRTRRGDATELVAELADKQRRLDLLDSDGDPQTAVRSVFSWSYQHLPAEAARVFRLLASLPGAEADTYAIAALAGSDLRTTRHTLSVLVRAHLLDELKPGRYQQHDLLCAYAAELAESTEDGAAAFTRLCAYYQHTAKLATNFLVHAADLRPAAPVPAGPTPTFTNHDDAFAWLDAERHNLLAIAEQAARDPESSVPTTLSTLLWRSLDTGGYYDEAATLHTLAIAAGRRHGNLVAEAYAARCLAITNRRLGNITDAMHHAEHALTLCRRAGHPLLEASTLSDMGALYADTGHFHKAAEYFEQAITLRSIADFPSVIDRANLGNLYDAQTGRTTRRPASPGGGPHPCGEGADHHARQQVPHGPRTDHAGPGTPQTGQPERGPNPPTRGPGDRPHHRRTQPGGESTEPPGRNPTGRRRRGRGPEPAHQRRHGRVGHQRPGGVGQRPHRPGQRPRKSGCRRGRDPPLADSADHLPRPRPTPGNGGSGKAHEVTRRLHPTTRTMGRERLPARAKTFSTGAVRRWRQRGAVAGSGCQTHTRNAPKHSPTTAAAGERLPKPAKRSLGTVR